MHSKTTGRLDRMRDNATRFGRTVASRTKALASPEKGSARRAVAGVALASLLSAGLVTATTAAVSASEERGARATAVDASARARDAERADRAARPAAPKAAAAPAKAAPKPAAKAPAKATKKPAKKAKQPPWNSPMPGVALSSCYGPRWGTMHQGIDFAGKAGTKIRAIGAGRVFAAGWTYSGYGISIVVDHGNGYFSHYAHASKALVKVGQKVAPGQPLALEGATGDSQGPHLHFEIHHGMWNQIDPAHWLRMHGVQIGC
jgi:murein DD-endopeptidase MepM/ murein hydrolase activator NlpD